MPTSTNGTTAGCVELAERAHLPPCQPDVPHAAPGQHLDRVQLIVGLGRRLVYLAHAAGADGVDQDIRPEDKALRLALQNSFGLEGAENVLAHQVFGEGGRFGPWVNSCRILADDLVELAAVDQTAAAKVPDEPFACARGRRSPWIYSPFRGRGERRAQPRRRCRPSEMADWGGYSNFADALGRRQRLIKSLSLFLIPVKAPYQDFRMATKSLS